MKGHVLLVLSLLVVATSCATPRRDSTDSEMLFTGTVRFSTFSSPGGRGFIDLDVTDGRLVRAYRKEIEDNGEVRERERTEFGPREHEWLRCVFALGLLELPDQAGLPEDSFMDTHECDGGGVEIEIKGSGIDRTIGYLCPSMRARPEDQTVTAILRIVSRHIAWRP